MITKIAIFIIATIIAISATTIAHAQQPPINLTEHPEINQDWYDGRNMILNPSIKTCFDVSLMPFVGQGAIPGCLQGMEKVNDGLCANPEVHEKIDACRTGKIQLYIDTFTPLLANKTNSNIFTNVTEPAQQ